MWKRGLSLFFLSVDDVIGDPSICDSVESLSDCTSNSELIERCCPCASANLRGGYTRLLEKELNTRSEGAIEVHDDIVSDLIFAAEGTQWSLMGWGVAQNQDINILSATYSGGLLAFGVRDNKFAIIDEPPGRRLLEEAEIYFLSNDEIFDQDDSGNHFALVNAWGKLTLYANGQLVNLNGFSLRSNGLLDKWEACWGKPQGVFIGKKLHLPKNLL